MSNKRAMKQKGRVIILSGPSGAGKTTLHDLVLDAPAFKGRVTRSISATTRKPRAGEKHGRDYLFLSEAMFRYKAKAGHFLEWAKVFSNCYGTPLKNVRDILRSGRHVILCIDVQGAGQVLKKCPDALTIFVKTPTLEDLRARLMKRGTDTPESVALRLKTAAQELKQAEHYRYVVVNEDLRAALKELTNIFHQELF